MKKTFLPLLGLAAAVALAQSGGVPPSGKRYALLVGNSAYRSLPPLPAAPAEVEVLKSALEGAGFTVTPLRDAGLLPFANSFTSFKLQPGDTFFFYFSGYTLQKDGENFLLPVDFNPKTANVQTAIRLNSLQDAMEKKTQGPKIFMLEAPHKLDILPDANSLQRADATRSHQSLFAFAAYDSPVVSGSGIGLFTKAVADQIGHAGSSPSNVFQNAKGSVIDTHQGQLPYVDDNITQQFYFHLPEVVKPEIIHDTKIVERAIKPGDTFHNSKDGEDYVWIERGTFQMGCVPNDKNCEGNENPQHQVVIGKNFWMGRNEVQVLSYVSMKPKLSLPKAPMEYSGWKKLDYPMVNVTWEQAGAYCAAAGGRLPTEAEWEYAARAGVKDQIYAFDPAQSQANYHGTQLQKDKIVERVLSVHHYKPNPWNLFDMEGNVWEWVNDKFADNYYQLVAPSITDPQGPDEGKEHGARGGSFDSVLTKQIRLSYRGHSKTELNSLGFRCVLDDSPATDKLLGR